VSISKKGDNFRGGLIKFKPKWGTPGEGSGRVELTESIWLRKKARSVLMRREEHKKTLRKKERKEGY